MQALLSSPRRLVVAAVLIVAACQLSTRAATVSICDETELRAALAEGGTVTFACDGTIALSNTLVIAANTVMDGSGREVVLSGRQAVRVFQVNLGVTFIARGLAIVDGVATNGAGLLNQGGTVQLLECTLSNNWALGEGLTSSNVSLSIGGGALFNDGGTVLASNSLFIANLARAATNNGPSQRALGGAIWNRGSLTVLRGRLIGNQALGAKGADGVSSYSGTVEGRDGGPALGGAIFSRGVLVLSDSGCSSNRAVGGPGGRGASFLEPPNSVPLSGRTGGMGAVGSGGAIQVAEGSFSVARSTLADNLAQGGDGGPGGPGKDGVTFGFTHGGNGGAGGSGGGGSGGAIHVEPDLTVSGFQNNTLSANRVQAGNGGQGGAGGNSGYSSGGFPGVSGQGGQGGKGGDATGSGIRFAAVSPTDPPVVLSAVADPGGSIILVTFNESLDPTSSQEVFNYAIDAGGGNVLPGIFAGAGPDDHTILLFLGQALASHQSNRLITSGICDLAGNCSSEQRTTITFDATPPEIVVGSCTLAFGSATEGAGGAGGRGGTPSGTNGLSGNVGVSLGGGLIATAGSVALENTILAYNGPGGNCSGSIVDAGNNIFSGPSCSPLAPGSWVNTDPLLGPLADNGGPAPTLALLSSSPAVDSAAGGSCPSTDQRGVPRSLGLGCDIGAFESSFTNEEPPAVLQCSQKSYSVSETNAWLVVPVVRTGGLARTVQVQFATVADSAQEGFDYVPTNGVLNFEAGVVTQFIQVRLRGDALVEGAETFGVSLSTPSGGAALGAITSALVTLTDAPATFLQFAALTFTAAESAGAAVITVTRSGNLDATVSVDYSTTNGTAISDSDYVATAGTLTLGPGVSSATFAVPLIDDTRVEPVETVVLVLSNPAGGATLGAPWFATLNVTSDDGVTAICSLEELTLAMQEGGRYVFKCDTTLVLTQTLAVVTDVVLDAAGHTVVLSGGYAVRLFSIQPGRTLSLQGLVLAQGADHEGGAIWNQAGTLHATDCLFSDNRAVGLPGLPSQSVGNPGYHGYGGAIASFSGVVNLTNVTLRGNLARGGQGGNNSGQHAMLAVGGSGGNGYGGAIFLNGGVLSAFHVTAQENRAEPGGPGYGPLDSGRVGGADGGALYATDAMITWLGGKLASNLCGQAADRAIAQTLTGGGLSLGNGSLVALDLLVQGNRIIGAAGSRFYPSQAASGGGFHLGGTSDARITNCAFVGNLAAGGTNLANGPAGDGRGGAIFNAGKLNLVNVTLANNAARGGDASEVAGYGRGGGLFNASGNNPVLLLHTTLAGNAAEAALNGIPNAALAEGGALYLANAATLKNSLLAYSPSGSNCVGLLVDGGYNLSSDTSCPMPAAGSRSGIDPRLAPLADNGGPTPTLALLPDSPALDAASSADCLPTDQRGRPRPMLRGCDIGAYEFAPDQFTVTRITLPSPGVVRLEGMGLAGQLFRVEASADFNQWTDVAAGAVLPNGLLSILAPRDGASRFYRLATP